MERDSDISDSTGLHRSLESPREDDRGYESLVRTEEDGTCSLPLLVGGVHCASCIQKIESAILSQPDVKAARLNFSTARLSISWSGPASRADDFVRMVEGLGYSVKPYDAGLEKLGAQAEEKCLLICLGISAFATANVMLLSEGLWSPWAETIGIGTRDLLHLFSAIITLPTLIFAGRPFFRSAYKALRGGTTNMDVPISLGLILTTGASLYQTFHHEEHAYFDAVVMLMFFLLIGRYLDVRARRSARSVAIDLLSSLTGFAQVVVADGTRKRLPISALRPDMLVRVAAGECIPVDGIVTEGASEIDTALVTGETLPRAAMVGGEVFAGTMNLSAPLLIRVAKAAEDSLLADIVRLMEKAGQGQARYVRLADRAARLYTPVVHVCAGLTFLLWWLGMGAGWEYALMNAVAVLIITCPCALALAVPVVQVLATGRLMKRGILVKSGDALERLAAVDVVVFDKTGTLTLGHMVYQGGGEGVALQTAATLAAQSSHPLSRALSAAYTGDLLLLTDVVERAGQGIEGRCEGRLMRLGSRDWCGDEAVPERTGQLEIWLSGEGKPPVPFYFSDQIKADSPEIVARFKAAGLKTVLLSGDRQSVADSVGAVCGVDESVAGQNPAQKYAFLEALKAQGHKVLMVGDGLNDAPALALADVSLSPASGIDMAQNAADIVFMGDLLSPVWEAYTVAQKSQILVKENFVLAVLYNVIAVPLAVAGLVTPLIAAVAMSVSSLMVIANAFRLRSIR